MYRTQHSIYRIRYHLHFQAPTGALGMQPPPDKGDCWALLGWGEDCPNDAGMLWWWGSIQCCRNAESRLEMRRSSLSEYSAKREKWGSMWLLGCLLSLQLLKALFKSEQVDGTEMLLITSVKEVKRCNQLRAKTKATLERKSLCHICINMCTSMIITIVIVCYCYTILIIYSMIIKYIILNIIPPQLPFINWNKPIKNFKMQPCNQQLNTR